MGRLLFLVKIVFTLCIRFSLSTYPIYNGKLSDVRKQVDYSDGFARQIESGDIYCHLNIFLDPKLLSHFKTKQLAYEFVKKGIDRANDILRANFALDGKPMIFYHIESISFLFKQSIKTNINLAENLIDAVNEHVHKHLSGRYCQNLYIANRDWGATLGAAYLILYKKPINLCNEYSSSIVMTTLLNNELVNINTFAYIFVHESGHTLGSDHDPEDYVSHKEKLVMDDRLRVDSDGNRRVLRFFIMSSSTQMLEDGVIPQFSERSAKIIMHNLFLKGYQCFKELNPGTCGDGIIDANEDCDSEHECCAAPSTISQCKFISRVECIPDSDNLCCNDRCKLKSNTEQCSLETDCSTDSYCNGINSTCPILPKDDSDDTLCDNNAGLCENGICQKSVCYKYNMVPCIVDYADCIITCVNKNGLCDVLLEDSKVKNIADGRPCGKHVGKCSNGHCMLDEFSPDMWDESIFDSEPNSQTRFIIIASVIGFVIFIMLVTIFNVLRYKRTRAVKSQAT